MSMHFINLHDESWKIENKRRILKKILSSLKKNEKKWCDLGINARICDYKKWINKMM